MSIVLLYQETKDLKERKKIISKIRNKGNLLLKKKTGKFIPKKLSCTNTLSDYIICVYCKAFLRTSYIERHNKKCGARRVPENAKWRNPKVGKINPPQSKSSFKCETLSETRDLNMFISSTAAPTENAIKLSFFEDKCYEANNKQQKYLRQTVNEDMQLPEFHIVQRWTNDEIDALKTHFASFMDKNSLYPRDGLPSQICSKCIIRINEAFSFKQQVENCDYTLKQNYSCKESINIDKRIKNNLEVTKIYVEQNYNTEIIKCEIKQEIESVDCLMNTEEVTIKTERIFVDNSSIVSSSTACSKEHDLDDIPSSDDSSSENACDGNVTTPGSPSWDVCTEDRPIGTDKKKRKKRRKQICSICGKTLVSSTYLRIHMRLHTGERPFQCKFPDCNRDFISVGDLSRHTRSHSVDLGLLKAELTSTSATSDEADALSASKLYSVSLLAIDACRNCSLL
ncbi:hypothetical protein FQA39_LY02068 [Lamprigera yunnana]|nr:hypothetical protein FQA39_LY02068 [Lamprigera yunnana]